MADYEALTTPGGNTYHEYGPLAAFEVPGEQILRIIDTESRVPVSWNSAEDYGLFGIPDPRSLKGTAVEVGSGLGGYALLAKKITVIEPCGYDDLEALMQKIKLDTTSPLVRELAGVLAGRAHTYRTSSNIEVVQASVQDVAEMRQGEFDTVISLGLVQHFRQKGQAQALIRKLGKPGADCYIF